MPEEGIFVRNVGLVPGWEAVLEDFASGEVLPRLANRTAIGVFLGWASAPCPHHHHPTRTAG